MRVRRIDILKGILTLQMILAHCIQFYVDLGRNPVALHISDYINLDTVFEFYEKLGHYVSASEKKEVEHLCACEMKLYGTDRAPFSYSQAGTTAEFITTGLLLGYPIESTVSVLHGN